MSDHIQLPLFGAGDHDTQITAAAMQSPERLTEMQNLVLATLAEHSDGLTDFELAEVTGRYKPSIGKRRTDCYAMGLVVDSGERRPTPSGANAIVWRLA